MSINSIRTFRLSLVMAAACLLLLPACSDEQAGEPGDGSGASGETVSTSNAPGVQPSRALIPQATPDLANDTIPLRAPDGRPARYGLASGRIVQRYSGGMKGERTIVFQDWGLRERKEEISAPDPPGRPGPIQNMIWISRPDSFGMVDVRGGTGWIMKNAMDDRYLASDSSSRKSLGQVIYESSPGTKLPDTTINGYECKVVNNKMPGIDHTVWVWRGIPIREHFIAPMDTMEFWIETVELQPGGTYADSTFRLPAGYTIERVEEPAPGSEWIPPHLRPQGVAPPGGAPPGGAPHGAIPPGAIPPGAAPPGMVPPPIGR